MHETGEDLARLQTLLDDSYARAGEHLRRVITQDRRLRAEELAEMLPDMQLLVLATVTATGHPIAGPVDGMFFRGEWYFGSAPDSTRFTHIRRSPWVSASHLPGEHLSVTVHGRAVPFGIAAPEHASFRSHLLSIYVPRYGAEWEQFLDSGVQYARIDAERMYTFSMPEG